MGSKITLYMTVNEGDKKKKDKDVSALFTKDPLLSLSLARNEGIGGRGCGD